MKSLQNNQGFTLIETFVAILILVFAVVGPLTIAHRGLNSTLIARDQLVATYLAQEAVEFIRYTRDNNVLKGNSWLNGLGNCTGAQGCYFDVWTSGGNIQTCPQAGCPVFRYNSANYRYQYASGSNTTFRRTVRIEGSSADERVIYVGVSWQSGSNSRTIEVRDRIFNWAGGLINPQ